jgi:hypothetical protein
MYEKKSLEIAGYRGLPVPNTFFRQQGETDHLGLVLPGQAYTSQAPLLFYPGQMLLSRGADVCLVDYAYDRNPDFGRLLVEEQGRWFFADVDAALQAAAAQRSYYRVTFVGKSLGTLGMGHMLSRAESLAGAYAVWITPLLRIEPLRAQIREWGGLSLFAIGTNDAHYDPKLLEEVRAATDGEAVVVEGGDHILGVGGDVWQSLRALEQVMRAVDAFLP